jgi:hypothetical protein
MFKNRRHTIRFLTVLFYFLLFGFSAFPQKITVHGIVKDEISLEPVSGVNIKINGTNQGVATNKEGRFDLVLEKIPVSITLSCVGYETVYYEIGRIPVKPIELILRKSIYNLKEVDISAKRYSYIFKNMDYSVLDYEIMDDQLLLLVFKYQLKRSELILLTLSGDTISVMQVPEMKPLCLVKDFLGNIHYISNKGNAFQCYFTKDINQFSFLYKTTYDSLRIMLQSFLFKTNDRYYFQELTPDGFGANIGYFDAKGHKEYIRSVSGETTRKNYADDQKFYGQWNSQLGTINPLEKEDNKPVSIEVNEQSGTEIIKGSDPLVEATNWSYVPTIEESDFQANKLFFYKRIRSPIVNLGNNNIAVFNFPDNEIEMMNQDGKLYRIIPISFHKEIEINLLAELITAFVPVPEWKWRGKILVDEYYRNVYTTFQKNGMVQIRKIDMETGNLTRSYDMPFPFPEKIQIYKGDAYFLNKEFGEEFQKWKLVKVKL